MATFLDFEKPIAELEGKIAELKHLAQGDEVNIAEEVAKLQTKVDRLLKTTYAKLGITANIVSPAEFGVFMKEEAVRWEALVKASKLPKVR